MSFKRVFSGFFPSHKKLSSVAVLPTNGTGGYRQRISYATAVAATAVA
jgi:hypothetical protein